MREVGVAGKRDAVIQEARKLRWEMGQDFHDRLMEDIYADAARIADRAITRNQAEGAFSWGRAVDRVVTSKILGFPLMILLFGVVFWITIVGANVPSAARPSRAKRTSF